MTQETELSHFSFEDEEEFTSLVPKPKYSDSPVTEEKKRKIYKQLLYYDDKTIKGYIKRCYNSCENNSICIWLSDPDNRFGCIIYSPVLLLSLYLVVYIIIQAIIQKPNVHHNNIEKYPRISRHDNIINNLLSINSVDKDGKDNDNPHIIWFVVDDLGYSDIGIHGSEFSTPNIDKIANDGIELKSHYVNPICSPSRSSFLTGMYAFRMGLQGKLEDLIHPGTTAHIPTKYKLVSNYFKDNGYNTKIYGKWHAGYSKKAYTPLERGFDSHIGFYNFGIDYFTKLNYDQWTNNGYDWHINGEVSYQNKDQYSTEILINSIEKDLDAYNSVDSKEPLFMYIAFQNPHFAVETPLNWNGYNNECNSIKDENRKKYCAHVQYLDYAIGKVLNSLKNNGLYDNSLIAFATDNGGSGENLCGNVGGHEVSASNYPYRAGKYTLFQGGILTNAFISGNLIPNELKNSKTETLFHATDWLPTLLHFINNGEYSNSLINYDIDGFDMYDVLFNHKINPRKDGYIILNIDYNEETNSYFDTAILYNNFKLIWNTHLLWADGSCDIRTSKPGSYPFKSYVNDLMNDKNWKEWDNMLLFNIYDDPYEYNDLLNGNGINGIEYQHYKILINKMINYIKNEKNNINKPWMPRQPWTFDNIDPQNYNAINGARIPWQKDDALEYPNNNDNLNTN